MFCSCVWRYILTANRNILVIRVTNTRSKSGPGSLSSLPNVENTKIGEEIFWNKSESELGILASLPGKQIQVRQNRKKVSLVFLSTWFPGSGN